MAHVILVGCAPPLASAPLPPVESSQPQQDPIALLPVETYPEDFEWRQRVTAEWEGGQREFLAVLSKSDGTLRLVGLDPMDRTDFVLSTRDGESIALEKRPSVEFPFDPRLILRDIQRCYYPWLPLLTATLMAPMKRTGTRADHLIVEEWDDARLLRRSFALSSDPQVERARADYDYEPRLDSVPARTVYLNVARGYRLTIETLEVASP